MNMSRTRSIIAQACFILLVTITARECWLLDDALGRAFLLHEDGTAYAPMYSEWRFRLVRRGMTIEELREALGDPLWIRTNDEKAIWRYTKDTADGPHRRRFVFVRDGIVVGKEAWARDD